MSIIIMVSEKEKKKKRKSTWGSRRISASRAPKRHVYTGLVLSWPEVVVVRPSTSVVFLKLTMRECLAMVVGGGGSWLNSECKKKTYQQDHMISLMCLVTRTAVATTKVLMNGDEHEAARIFNK